MISFYGNVRADGSSKFGETTYVVFSSFAGLGEEMRRFMEVPSYDLKLRAGWGPNRKPGNSGKNTKLPFR